MKVVSDLWRLSSADWRLLLKTGALVVSIRLGLWMLPFSVLMRRLNRFRGMHGWSDSQGRTTARRVVWAVTVTSRLVPAATCLTQALATQVLLSRLGYPADLKIGVAKDTKGRLEAHAWVESAGTVVIGRVADISRYRMLSPFNEEAL